MCILKQQGKHPINILLDIVGYLSHLHNLLRKRRLSTQPLQTIHVTVPTQDIRCIHTIMELRAATNHNVNDGGPDPGSPHKKNSNPRLCCEISTGSQFAQKLNAAAHQCTIQHTCHIALLAPIGTRANCDAILVEVVRFECHKLNAWRSACQADWNTATPIHINRMSRSDMQSKADVAVASG
jgi:hypothetical protein